MANPIISLVDMPTWASLDNVVVLSIVIALFMQFMGKGLIKVFIRLLMCGLFKLPPDQLEDWPGRNPVYFGSMLTLGFILLVWRGIDSGPALIDALVATCLASGEYELFKSAIRAAGKRLVPTTKTKPPCCSKSP